VYHQSCTEALEKYKNYNKVPRLCANPIYRSSPPSVTAEDELEVADGVDLMDPLDQEKHRHTKVLI
jgi:hypothetical protein